HVTDQGIEARPALGFVYARHGQRIGGVRRQPVNSLCGNGDRPAICQNCTGFLDDPVAIIVDVEDVCTHDPRVLSRKCTPRQSETLESYSFLIAARSVLSGAASIRTFFRA